MPIVEPVTRCAHLVTQLADGFAVEWPEWARTLSREELERTFTCGGDGDLPLVLVAHEGEIALGTVALREWFGDEPMAESPWVRGFYVVPRARGKGIDRLLICALEREARERGFECLYAATTRIERFAVRRGWQVFRRLEHQGEPMAWMRRALGSP